VQLIGRAGKRTDDLGDSGKERETIVSTGISTIPISASYSDAVSALAYLVTSNFLVSSLPVVDYRNSKKHKRQEVLEGISLLKVRSCVDTNQNL